MFKQVSYFLPLIFALILVSCAPKQSEIVVAEYGGKEITMKEFEDAYAKSAGGYEAAKKDSLSKLKNFLDLYVNFKMKLRDAEVRDYAADPSLQSELLDYKKRVGVTYLLEKDIVEPGVEDLYEKRKWELRVSHIMIRPDSAGEEAAKVKTQAILDSIKAGSSFEEMAQKYSSDNYSRPVGGDIYYVTAGMLPSEFEDAMYKTEVGKVYPEVVQTKFGFHIIKITEKQPRVPFIRASHILAQFRDPEGKIDSAAAKATIDSAAAFLKQGKDFAEVAKQFSQDGSKQNGGDLGFFERRNMVKDFDEAAFKLDVGQVSDIIKTQYGYHIIKLTEKKPYPALAEERENLKKIFRQQRFQDEYNNLVDSLKKVYSYKFYPAVLDEIAAANDSVKIDGEFNIENTKDKVVFEFNGKTVNADQFITKLNELQDFKNKLVTPEIIKAGAEKIGGELLLEEEAITLEQKSPQFADLMDDYRNGIYIFKLQEDEVWNKIDLDSTRLYQYYTENKEKYVWPDRVSFNEIYSRKDSLINLYYSYLQEGQNFDSVAAKYTERAGYKEKAGFYPLVDVKASALSEEADKLASPGEYSKPFKSTGGQSIVKLVEKDPSRIKTFEEAKAEVSGAVQEVESKRLEQEYVENLKKKYEPVIYYETLDKAFPEGESADITMENSDKASK
jgi:peptidyl-prolyl cis-trans isomerase SurA